MSFLFKKGRMKNILLFGLGMPIGFVLVIAALIAMAIPCALLIPIIVLLDYAERKS